jgi:hypothetical protein
MNGEQLESGMNGPGEREPEMNTHETELKVELPASGGLHGLGNANGTLMGANLGQGSFAAKERKERKRRRRKAARQESDGEKFSDPITRALRRNREATSYVKFPEGDWWARHVFRCVCCGRVRSEEERREPRSSLCIRCVREAGFWN